MHVVKIKMADKVNLSCLQVYNTIIVGIWWIYVQKKCSNNNIVDIFLQTGVKMASQWVYFQFFSLEVVGSQQWGISFDRV